MATGRQGTWETRGSNVTHCDLEFLELPCARFKDAILSHALLTGSIMTGADFRGASLRQAGLADIAWEQADLREADLRGCSFHLGSSRSGLVGSPYPGHGSRTGFYTNDYDEQSYEAPETIREANLCGADLRGVSIEGVDFYLVDLRGAVRSRAGQHISASVMLFSSAAQRNSPRGFDRTLESFDRHVRVLTSVRGLLEQCGQCTTCLACKGTNGTPHRVSIANLASGSKAPLSSCREPAG